MDYVIRELKQNEINLLDTVFYIDTKHMIKKHC